MAVRHKPNSFLSGKWLSRPTRPLVERWNIYYSNIARFVDIHMVTTNKSQICHRFTFVGGLRLWKIGVYVSGLKKFYVCGRCYVCGWFYVCGEIGFMFVGNFYICGWFTFVGVTHPFNMRLVKGRMKNRGESYSSLFWLLIPDTYNVIS